MRRVAHASFTSMDLPFSNCTSPSNSPFDTNGIGKAMTCFFLGPMYVSFINLLDEIGLWSNREHPHLLVRIVFQLNHFMTAHIEATFLENLVHHASNGLAVVDLVIGNDDFHAIPLPLP